VVAESGAARARDPPDVVANAIVTRILVRFRSFARSRATEITAAVESMDDGQFVLQFSRFARSQPPMERIVMLELISSP
jgi:hypothetical protein